MGTIAASLRLTRIVHLVFLAALVLYAVAAEQVAGKNHNNLQPLFLYAIVFLAGLVALVGSILHRTKVRAAVDRLGRNPEDTQALTEWRKFTLVCLVFALSVALYGFTLRFLGAPRQIAWSFYLAAAILLLLWRPNLELPVEPPAPPTQ